MCLKTIVSIALFFCLLTLTGISELKTANATTIRYFMQAENVQGSKTPYGNNPSTGHYAQADDAKIYYEVYGKGKPLVILHGGGVGTPYEMGKLIDNLRRDYQVIVVSTRGHGRSEIGHNPLTYEQKANDIMAVIRKEDCASVSIIGFSDGAYTAYKVASMYPQTTEKIVAIGAGTLSPGYFKAGTLNVADVKGG